MFVNSKTSEINYSSLESHHIGIEAGGILVRSHQCSHTTVKVIILIQQSKPSKRWCDFRDTCPDEVSRHQGS